MQAVTVVYTTCVRVPTLSVLCRFVLAIFGVLVTSTHKRDEQTDRRDSTLNAASCR